MTVLGAAETRRGNSEEPRLAHCWPGDSVGLCPPSWRPSLWDAPPGHRWLLSPLTANKWLKAKGQSGHQFLVRPLKVGVAGASEDMVVRNGSVMAGQAASRTSGVSCRDSASRSRKGGHARGATLAAGALVPTESDVITVPQSGSMQTL